MVAAVTCVCSHPEEATSVPVPPTSIWLLMENSACPTVQPARCVCVSLAQISKYFPEMQNGSTFYLYFFYLYSLFFNGGSCLIRVIKVLKVLLLPLTTKEL